MCATFVLAPVFVFFVCPMPRPSLVCVCLVSSPNARTREPLYMELQKPASVGKTDAGKEPAETVSSSSNTNTKEIQIQKIYKYKRNTNTK